MTCEKESVTMSRLAHSFVSVIDVLPSYIEKECVYVNVHACVRERARKRRMRSTTAWLFYPIFGLKTSPEMLPYLAQAR